MSNLVGPAEYVGIEQARMKQKIFIEKVTNKINGLGLTAPAILLLEAHKPLAFIGSQLLLIAQPTLNIFLSRRLTQNTINLLADSTQLERLIISLEINKSQNSAPSSSRVETKLTTHQGPRSTHWLEKESKP